MSDTPEAKIADVMPPEYRAALEAAIKTNAEVAKNYDNHGRSSMPIDIDDVITLSIAAKLWLLTSGVPAVPPTTEREAVNDTTLGGGGETCAKCGQPYARYLSHSVGPVDGHLPVPKGAGHKRGRETA